MCSLTDDLDFENEVPSDFKQTSKYLRGVDRNKRVQGTTDAVSVRLFKFVFRTFTSEFYLPAIQKLLQLRTWNCVISLELQAIKRNRDSNLDILFGAFHMHSTGQR